MSINLGYRPTGLTVTVTPSSTFSAVLRSGSGAWADGTAITLVFHDSQGASVATWPAVIAADTATWTETPTAVNALIASTPARVELWYTDGTNPIEWARGTVKEAL